VALSTYIKEFFGRAQLVLKSSAASQLDALGETDGKLMASLYGKASGTSTALATEATGEQKVTNYGKASGTVTVFKLETTGEQDIVLHGKQTGGTIGAVNLNANNVLRIEIVNGGVVQADPVLIPNAEGILWNPNTTSASIYELSFNIVNSTSSDVTGVNVGVDIGAGGSLSAGEYYVQGLIVPLNGSSGWYGPFVLDGADRVRGVAGTNNVLSIHFNIRQVFTA
jgi:hypothetical protein